MAQKVLILGDSGTGKSASLRNFKEDEVFVINTAGKPLPGNKLHNGAVDQDHAEENGCHRHDDRQKRRFFQQLR